MKMTKTELKAIIKECLIEILTDSLGGSLKESRHTSVSEATQPRQSRVTYAARKPTTDPLLDSPALRPDALKALAEGDDVMASIFADTVGSTLQKQGLKFSYDEGTGSTGAPHADMMAEAVSRIDDPNEAFGGGGEASWAEVAFKGFDDRARMSGKKLPGL